MESSSNKLTTDGKNTMTTGYSQGHAQDSSGNEGKPLNPFARASRVGRTPPRPRVDSCPEMRHASSNPWVVEDRDKRKRAEAISPPSDSMAATPTSEKDLRIGGGDEVFVEEGSPSPGTIRETKKRKEQEPSSLHMAWKEMTANTEVTEMSNGLRQLMQKMEKMAGDLAFETKKNVNTKVEIKKMARELDVMSQNLSRKLNKYCTAVGRKLRKFSDKDDTSTRVTRGNTQDVASQTDPLPRKPRGEDIKRVTEAVTDEEILDAVNRKWQEGWFQATTINVGNPWNSTGEADYAILVLENEEQMDTGILRLLRDRFPEVGSIKGTGSLRVTNTVQVGTAEPTTKTRAIHRVRLGGTTDAEVLVALRALDTLAQESKMVAVPVPTGTDEGKVRKLAEMVFRNRATKLAIHVPQGKGGKDKKQGQGKRVDSAENRRGRNTEVLLIKQGGKTYGDMVRGLRALVGVRNDALKQVRKAQDGRLLLAFKKGEPEVEVMKSLIQTSWEGAEVLGGGKRDTHKGVLHLKGLDVAVEEEEIWEAVHDVVPTLQKEDLVIGEKRPMFGGNLAVTVKVPDRFMQELRKRDKLKIGLNVCRMEERLDVTKCYRCWEYGHLARVCKGPDRKNLCSGCGQEGHMVAACSNAPHCALCGEGHRSGSAGCPKFREALKIEKRAAREQQNAQPQDQEGERPPPPVR